MIRRHRQATQTTTKRTNNELTKEENSLKRELIDTSTKEPKASFQQRESLPSRQIKQHHSSSLGETFESKATLLFEVFV